MNQKKNTDTITLFKIAHNKFALRKSVLRKQSIMKKSIASSSTVIVSYKKESPNTIVIVQTKEALKN